MKNQILGTQEFRIDQVKSDISIKDVSKSYIVMFKYDEGQWCYALPIKSMYLQTIASCKYDIFQMQERNNDKGYSCEFKIAQVIN